MAFAKISIKKPGVAAPIGDTDAGFVIAFSLGVRTDEANAAPTDVPTFAIALLDAITNPAPTDDQTLRILVDEAANPAQDETIELRFPAGDFDESNVVPTDVATFALALLDEMTNPVQDETVKATFPAGDFDEPNVAPSEAIAARVDVWLSGSIAESANGVTNPADANGENNATNCVIQSAALGDSTPSALSNITTNVPSGTVTAAVYRGWFRAQLGLGSNNILIRGVYSGGSVNIYTALQSGVPVTTDDNFLDGSFTVDLFALGVNTAAKLQTLQIRFSTDDVTSGVAPGTLTVDAGRAEISYSALL